MQTAIALYDGNDDAAAHRRTAQILKSTRHFLRSAFTGVAVSAAIRYTATAGANIAGLTSCAALFNGAALAGYEAFKDYRKARQDGANRHDALRSLATRDNGVKYVKKFVLHTAGFFAGALGLDTALEHLAQTDMAQAALDRAEKTVAFLGHLLNPFGGALAATGKPEFEGDAFSPPRAHDVLQVSPPETVMEEANVPDLPADRVTALVQDIDTTGWSKKALADLAAAERGQPWAIQNIAHYLANGREGLDKDLAAAARFAQIGADMNYGLSERFLGDLGRLAPDSVPDAAVADHAESAGKVAAFCEASRAGSSYAMECDILTEHPAPGDEIRFSFKEASIGETVELGPKSAALGTESAITQASGPFLERATEEWERAEANRIAAARVAALF